MRNADLSTNVEELHQVIATMAQEIRELKEQLHLATRRQFGKASEPFPAEQLLLFTTPDSDLVVLETDDMEDNHSSGDPSPEPKKRNVRQAVIVSKETPVDRVELDLDEAEKTCPCCQGELHKIGEDCTRQVEYLPPQTRVIETIRPKYACRMCETGIKQQLLPPSPIPKSMATPSLLAFLIVSKYLDHLPLHRIQRQLARVGITLPRSTQSDWMMACANLLRRLVDVMKQDLLAMPQIFTDDTILPLQNDDKQRDSLIKARLWVYAGQYKTGPPIVLYDFTRSRSKSGPVGFLNDYTGYLQADAYSGYDELYTLGAKEVGCMAHCRRKFFEAAELESTPGSATHALAIIGQLYQIERDVKQASPKKRKKHRRRFAKPLLKKFHRWLQTQRQYHLPKGKFAKAVNYALNHWLALTRYCDAGYLAIDNNFSERQMRPIALGRKNYLFTGSERGGNAAAILYSLVETAKLNKLNVYHYLSNVLQRLPSANNNELDELLPYHWQAKG